MTSSNPDWDSFLQFQVYRDSLGLQFEGNRTNIYRNTFENKKSDMQTYLHTNQRISRERKNATQCAYVRYLDGYTLLISIDY